MTPTSEASAVESARLLRAFVLVALGVGLAGVSADLIVLKHFEDSWQLVPLVLIAIAFGAIVWYLAGGGAPSLRLLQGTMALFLAAGVMGVVLHYRGNLEFQLEIDPSQHGWDLFAKVIQAKAPPALAPGAMAQLGLLGLAYVFRHPALRRAHGRDSSSEGV
jgi:hypothetical protein